uniref:Uncharacterized protein n=1 Tax=Steinernema glaseri TaxID=37863 RepID=A0A1I7ZVU5_9BILA
MLRRIAFFAIAFAIFVSTSADDDCDPSYLKDRVAAGFYNGVFFYFSYGEHPKTLLSPKTLFGDFWMNLAPDTTPTHILPLRDHRIMLFYIKEDRAYYEVKKLDNLTEHALNGSAKVMPMSELTSSISISIDNGSILEEILSKGIIYTNGTLTLGNKPINNIELKPEDGIADVYTVFPMEHLEAHEISEVGETTLREGRSKLRETFFRVAEANMSECIYAQTQLLYFSGLQLLPREYFNTSKPITTSTPATTATTPTPTTTMEPTICGDAFSTGSVRLTALISSVVFGAIGVTFGVVWKCCNFSCLMGKAKKDQSAKLDSEGKRQPSVSEGHSEQQVTPDVQQSVPTGQQNAQSVAQPAGQPAAQPSAQAPPEPSAQPSAQAPPEPSAQAPPEPSAQAPPEATSQHQSVAM